MFLNTDADERRETSYSLEAPPKITRTFFKIITLIYINLSNTKIQSKFYHIKKIKSIIKYYDILRIVFTFSIKNATIRYIKHKRGKF